MKNSRRPQSRAIALVAAVLALVAGCGGGSGANDAEDLSGLKVGYASEPDTTDLINKVWLEENDMNVVSLSRNQTVVTALARGNIDVANVQLTDVVQAVQEGLPLTVFYVGEKEVEFLMVARPEIENFDDLAGKKVAYHSAGSLTEVVQRALVRQHDPALEKKIKWTVLPESPNRVRALKAGRISATAVEYIDLTKMGKENANVLGHWGDLTGDAGDAVNSVWVARTELYEDEPEVIQSLASEIQSAYRTFYKDKQRWLDLGTETLPDYFDRQSLSATYDYYKDIEIYPVDGQTALDEKSWKEMDKFYRSLDAYEDPADPEMVAWDVIKESSRAG